nr:uncharacterized protein LOC112721656 [Arachis hypogaea]
MPGLDRSLIEYRLALKPNTRPVKQTPRRFAPEINVKIKEEIERLIKAKFIRTTRYLEWVSNIVPVMKKNGKLRVCIDFRDLNNATAKDEYFMPIANMLIDSAAGNEILSFMDGYSGYNQIFIAEDDVAKTAFRCPGALAFENTIGCMLAQDDENGHERAVYYLSRVLTDIETRYSPIEKLCLSLYHACMKLKCYIVAKSVKVIAQTDLIKYMLSFPILRGRLGKWMLALTEFDLQYVPAKTVKGQVIADFLVDNSKDLHDQGKNIVDVEVNYWKLYFDGSKNKDGAGVGILIISLEDIPSEFLFELKYPCSNNVVEYEALILGLEILIEKGVLEVQILGDSQLVLKQLSKEFKCNNEMLQKYLVTAWELLTSFQKVSLVHIPRIHNEIANELAQIASRYRVGPETFRKLSGIHQILVLANEREVLCIDGWEDSDWRKTIALYLKDPNVAVDRKIKLRAMNFVLLAYELYKKGIDGSLLRCLSRDDQSIALDEVHNGICGAHQARKKMRWVLYRNHVYWPSMIKDCIDYAKACLECQKHGSIQQIPASELHSIIKPWPFRGWALDLIGLIHPPSSKQHKFILVAIDYFTKWVEAIPLIEVSQNEIIDFIEEHIIHRFGIPQTLSTDQGTMFTGHRMKSFAASRSINMITLTPYYAQANGQVEAANKILIGLIKNHIGNKSRTWHETLSQVLWAYQNSPRVDDYWNAMFDELNELDSERILALDNVIRQKESVAQSYNHRIKKKSFKIGSNSIEGLDVAGLEIAGTGTEILFSWITLFKTEIKLSKKELVGVVEALVVPGLGPGGI